MGGHLFFNNLWSLAHVSFWHPPQTKKGEVFGNRQVPKNETTWKKQLQAGFNNTQSSRNRRFRKQPQQNSHHRFRPSEKTPGLVFWLVVSTLSKNISQIGNLPQIGVKIKNIWNHHPVFLEKNPPKFPSSGERKLTPPSHPPQGKEVHRVLGWLENKNRFLSLIIAGVLLKQKHAKTNTQTNKQTNKQGAVFWNPSVRNGLTIFEKPLVGGHVKNL